VILAPERQIATFGSTSFRFYLISELMLVAAFVLLIGWTMWYVRKLGSNADEPAAESA